MIPYFISEEQKTDCLQVLEDSVAMWEEMRKTYNPQKRIGSGPPRVSFKYSAIRSLFDENPEILHFFRDGKHCAAPDHITHFPKNGCFLCSYADAQTKKHAGTPEQLDELCETFSSGFACRAFCPVIWNREANPENRDTKDFLSNTPCESAGSPYQDYISCQMQNVPAALDAMCRILAETKARIQNIPVLPDKPIDLSVYLEERKGADA